MKRVVFLHRFVFFLGALGWLSLAFGIKAAPAGDVTQPFDNGPLSPGAIVASPDGQLLYVACATAGRVAVLDAARPAVLRSIAVPQAPLGLAISADGTRLYVTCAAAESVIAVVDPVRGALTNVLSAGHTAMAPVLSSDGRTLYVADRFDNQVEFVDLASGRTVRRVRVSREPVAMDLTPDGRRLFVANHLPAGRADVDVVAALVSVIDATSGEVCREIKLPNGSTLVRGVRVSPDGRHAVVVHQLSRFHLPTTQVDRGWINTSALSVIDVAGLRRINSVLLDDIDAGAANPWGVAWSPDGRSVLVSHAGTHELSVIDFPALLAKLERLAAGQAAPKDDLSVASRVAADVPNDLSFLVGLRRRLRLSPEDRSPRALALVGSRAFLANYFSDSISIVDLAAPRPRIETFPLDSHREVSRVRRGELLFNDATMCFQGWQSCASCHSADARVDGLNWDNLNDGIGNPKSSKSLLLAMETAPSMWLGVRADAHVAVRAGIRNSLFTVQPPEVAECMDDYLASLRPMPSPRLQRGQLSPAAERGRRIFFRESVGCAECHSGSLYTDRKFHEVGTVGRFDQSTNRFDTPTLMEVWRSAPYLHDGRATTIREVLTTANPADRHGVTSPLQPAEIDDLAEFILSL